MPPLPIEDYPYFETGLQYYVTGRYAAIHACIPVAASLFHHAVEMFLKAGLRSIYTSEQLKKLHGHDLLALWAEFKTKANEPSLSAYDGFLTELNRWEHLRYPPWAAPDSSTQVALPLRRATQVSLAAGGATTYIFAVEDVDELVATLVPLLSVGPPFFYMRLSAFRALDVYQFENHHVLAT